MYKTNFLIFLYFSTTNCYFTVLEYLLPDAVPKMASATGMFETAASSGFGSFKAASQLKQGSVMDILGASGTSNSSMASASGFGGPIKPASQLSSGSVMDVLRVGKNEASAAASPASSGVKAVPKSKQETVIAEQKKGENLMILACNQMVKGHLSLKIAYTKRLLFNMWPAKILIV